MQKQSPPSPRTTRQHIALIAGIGVLPVEAARQLTQDGASFFIVSLFPDDNAEQLQAHTNELISESVFKLSRIIQLLKNRGTTDVLFIGKVDKRHLLGKLSYDWLLTKLLAKAIFKNDSELMNILIHELRKHGIGTISQRAVLKNLFVPAGVITGRLTEALKKDVSLGMRVAEQLSQADVGQTVVVKNGMVLAVEAIEGTDECIARGAALGKGKVVVCKTARITQSDKFDIPTLGPGTLETLDPDHVTALAWHNTRTMIADYERFVELAEEKNITLLSVEAPCDSAS